MKHILDIPSTWNYISLTKDLNYIQTGVKKYTEYKKYYSTGSIKDYKYCPEGEYLFDNKPSRANRIGEKGDVFQARMKDTNKCLIVNDELSNNLFSTGFIQLKGYGDTVESKFIFFYLSSQLFLNAKNDLCSGSTQSALNDKAAVKLIFPLAPQKEQLRIIHRIEELFSELDKGIESLKTAKAQLAVYRQSLLKHAFEGKLTAQWRKDNADKLESPEQLLTRIQQERKARYQQQLNDWEVAVKKWETDGKEGKKPSKPPKPKKLDDPAIDPSIFVKLPENWMWTRIGELNVDVFDGPFGSNLKTIDYVEKGIRVIRLENIGTGHFIDSKQTFITDLKYQLLKRHHVSHGDIVFSSFVIDKIRVALVPDSITEAINKADCFCVRAFGDLVSSEYMLHHLSSMHVFKQIEELVHGVGRPRINTTQLKNIWLPICSKEEQLEIIQKINEQMVLISHFEQEIDENLKKSEVLRQSILKRAFSGRLVSQDPTDEPASELLKKIAIEKAELEANEKAEKAAARKIKTKSKKSVTSKKTESEKK